MYKKHFYTVVILLSFLTFGVQQAFGQVVHTLIDGNTKYNTDFGAWDGNTFTFSSSPPLEHSIKIINYNFPDNSTNPIVIDGAGKTIDLDLNGGKGVYLYNNTYVTIQNLNVTKCDEGISLDFVNHIDLIDNNVSNCQHGIYMFRAGTCDSTEGEGITGNNIVSNWWGIEVHSCEKIDIYNNNFIDNNVQAELKIDSSNPSNVEIYFDLGLSTSGNYWSDWGPPDTADDDNNGIWDDPYIVQPVGSFQDNFPWVVNNGWLGPGVLIVQLIDTVEDMNLQQGINNGLDAKLDAALNALDDINQNNDVAAINSLNAFINAVEIQRDNGRITIAQAEILIKDATDIITLLGG